MPFEESVTRLAAILASRISILSFLYLALMSGSAAAESVSYFGRSFEVSGLENVGGDQVKVDIHGQELIASRQDVGKKVFEIYADRPDLLSIKSIDSGYGSFVVSLSQGGAQDEALAAILGLLTSQGVPDQARWNFFSGVTSSSEGGDLVVDALRRMDIANRQRDSACLVLPSLPLHSATRAQKLLFSDLSWLLPLCPQKLIQMAQEELVLGELDRGARTLSFVGSFFKGASDLAQAAESSAERLRVVREAVASGNADTFEVALRAASFDPLIREYYRRSQGDSVADFCFHALSLHHPAAVFQSLALLDFSDRDNRHHEIALQALRSLTYRDMPVVTKESVRKMLWAYSAKDQNLKDDYIKLLSAGVEEATREGQPELGALYVGILKDIRTDPSLENDRLRGLVAESFVDSDNLMSAEDVMKGVQTSIPWIIRFRLLLKLDRYVLLMVLLGLLVVARFLKKGFARCRGRATSTSKESHDDPQRSSAKVEADESARKRQRPNFDLKQSMYKGLDEYADCLDKFQLQPGASLADIKNAYRAVVKSLHPDLNPKASKEDTVRFIELTKAYERLIELHEERAQRGDKSPDNLN